MSVGWPAITRNKRVFNIIFLWKLKIEDKLKKRSKEKSTRQRKERFWSILQWVTRFQRTGIMISCNIFYILPGMTGETWELVIDCTFTPDIAILNHSTTVHLIEIDRKLEYLIKAGRNNFLFYFVLFCLSSKSHLFGFWWFKFWLYGVCLSLKDSIITKSKTVHQRQRKGVCIMK